MLGKLRASAGKLPQAKAIVPLHRREYLNVRSFISSEHSRNPCCQGKFPALELAVRNLCR
jgi:hypothetical protein